MAAGAAETISYEEFLDAVEGGVREFMGCAYLVERNKVLKNNSIECDSLMIHEAGELVAPTIYLNDFYRNHLRGDDIPTIIRQIANIYFDNRHALHAEDFEDMSLETVRERLILKLVNYENNRLLLEEVPHFRYKDLAVTFHQMIIADNGSVGTIRVTNRDMERWEMTPEEMFRIACDNTSTKLPYELQTMTDFLIGLLEVKLRTVNDSGEQNTEQTEAELEDLIRNIAIMEEHSDEGQMYILTTSFKINGAACALYRGLLGEIREKLGEDFYILPSSVQELILVPDSIACEEQLRAMVPMVNRNEVDPLDVLSDEIYHYPEDDFVII